LFFVRFMRNILRCGGGTENSAKFAKFPFLDLLRYVCVVCYTYSTMRTNYRIPPVSTSDPFAMLRYFGINAVPTSDTCLIRRGLNYTFHVFDSARLPRISCPLTNNPDSLIRISFPGPPSFGNQSFEFEPDVLLDAVREVSFAQDGKGRRRLSAVPSLNVSSSFLAFVLDSFSISPTVILRVYNHKRGYQKLQLQPSLTKFNALVNENKNGQK